MMLITLTILLPLVHTVAGTECHAEPIKTVNTSALPDQVLKQLEKEGAIIWDKYSLAVYYEGFPDVQNSNRQFIAACAGGLENRAFHNCVNATHIDGVEGGHNITKTEFLKFYHECNFAAGFVKFEEEEDDWDRGKSESEEERQELADAAGAGEEN
uniref:Secreted protein n=1 Tax=Haemonchus contortus TaxID=6289 RepID=A0A6F7NSJ8_HAECO|nr:unnamed protein product [Haemonchus contortus]